MLAPLLLMLLGYCALGALSSAEQQPYAMRTSRMLRQKPRGRALQQFQRCGVSDAAFPMTARQEAVYILCDSACMHCTSAWQCCERSATQFGCRPVPIQLMNVTVIEPMQDCHAQVHALTRYGVAMLHLGHDVFCP